MKIILFISVLFLAVELSAQHELARMTEAENKIFIGCMDEKNDLHACYKIATGQFNNENCTEDFETGKLVCKDGSGSARSKEVNSAPSSKTLCQTTYSVTKSKCNGNQVLQNSQSVILLNAIQKNKNVGNIKEACEAANQINSASWNLNTTYALQCNNAINKCLSECTASSFEYGACEELQKNVKLAQNQSIENAKAYAQSQECVTVASGCGSNSYDNPNCPQYCLKPGRQSDPLCNKNSNSVAQNSFTNTQAPSIPSSQNPIHIVGTTSNSPSLSKNYGDKNDFSKDDDGSGFDKKAKVNAEESGSNGSGSGGKLNSLAGVEVSKQQKEKDSISNKPTTITGSIDGSNGVYIPSNPKGYSDTNTTEDEDKSWFDLKRFFPESEEEKINRNITQYHQKLLARKHRPTNTINSNQRSNKGHGDSKMTREHERSLASIDVGLKPSSKAIILLSLLASFGVIYFVFLKKKA